MIRLIVDSTCCMSKEYAKKNGIEIVNLEVMLGDLHQEEGFSDNWKEFFVKLKGTKDFPKTSQPAPERFEKACEKILKEDKDAKIIILTISNTISGTINAAQIAASKFPKGTVFAIDSGACVQSNLVIAEEIIERIKKGITIDTLLREIEKMKAHAMIQFVPSTMEYLKRGGRIGALSATIANVLNIKPIITFKNGVLSSKKKTLGMMNAITEMVKSIPEKFKKLKLAYIYESDFLVKLQEKVKSFLGMDKTLEVAAIGPVVGSHIGIGAIGIATLEDYGAED